VTELSVRPSRRAWWKYLLVLAGGVGLIILAGLWYITTDSFQGLVRRRLVAEVERITGGRAQIGSFHTTPFRMQVEVRDITVRGRETATDIPLAHTDRLVAQVKVISFLGTEFGFHDLVLDHPVVHVIFYPDGSTNVSGPRIPTTSGKTPIEKLFGLSIDQLDVRHGELLWDDQAIPVDFTVHDAAVHMEYSYLQRRYQGSVLLGKADTRFEDFRPFAWMASAEFSLGTTYADIKLLKLNSGRSRLETSGRVSDFRRPNLQGTYDAYLDLGEAASISRRRDLREGIVEFKGKGTWSIEQFATSGALALRDLGWQDNQIGLKKANATADYYVSDKEIKLSKLQGKLLEGSFTGDAQIDNWLESASVSKVSNRGQKISAQPVPQSENDQIANVTAARPQRPLPNKKESNKKEKERPKLALVQTGFVHLRLRDVSTRALAVALNTVAHPVGSFRPAGSATGTLDARWKGSLRDAEVAFMFNLNPPSRSAPGELPVTASIQGTYRGSREELELSRMNASTPASRVQASGTLSASSALRLSLLTTNLDELRPIIAALHGPADMPFSVHGSASFNGVVSGTISNPTLAGNLTAQDFEFALPATSRSPQQQVHWDSLSTGVQLSARGLTLRGGSLRRGDTSAEFEVTAALQHGQFTADDPFTARINLHNVDVGSTAVLSGYDYPLTGKADLFLQVAGTRSNPQAQGTVHATDASAYGQSISRFDADLNIAGGETALSNIHLVHDDSAVTGSAAYDPLTHVFKLDLVGTNFDLSRIPHVHSDRLSVEGRGGFTLRGSGTLDDPNITASVHIDDLTLDHELAGAFDLEATTKGRELHLAGRSNFSRGTLSVDGTVQIRDDYPANIELRMDSLDLDALWRSYLRGQVTGHSAVAGTLTMQGPLRDPRAWNVNGNFTSVAVDVEYAKLQNQDPVRFTYAQQSLRIEQMHFVGEGTDLTAHGSAHLAGSRELDLAAEGHVDLKLLNSFDADLAAAGVMTMNMTVGGTIAEPFPQGRLQLANGTVTYAGLPSGLSEMNGSLVFTRDRIHIEKLTARTGGGTLDLKGDATTYDRQLNFNLTAVGKEVRLRYPPGVSSVADAELHWVGTRSSSTVSGEIMVTKLAVTPNFDFSSYLERSRHIGSVTPANSPLYGVKLDIHVQTAPELQMKTAVARLSGDADLRIRGSVARPSVLGRADILEGEATFNGTKFRLERGDITFANPVTIEPLVNLQASTHVRNYDLNITVTGSPDRLAVNYRSEPPLPKSDIIALLALGRTSEESQQLQQQSGQSPFTDEASAMIINQAINSTVSSRMQKLFGVSRIKIDPQGLTTETNPTARGPQVTIEQQFANNVSLTYSTNVSQSSQQIIQGEYYFTRSISLVGTRDQNGVISFDVRIRRQKK
jgi:translocation and assembly module TamB